MGRALSNNLINLGMYDVARDAMKMLKKYPPEVKK